MRPIPAACLTLIHQFEGNQGRFEPTRALDPTGHAEIGWSHALSGPDDALWNATLDEASADALAMRDLESSAISVGVGLGNAIDEISENQYAALIDFTYNEGAGHFISSTLCRMVKAGDYAGAADQFARWTYSDGIQLAGLIRRRAAEKVLWLTPD